jgi:hypothetical protein
LEFPRRCARFQYPLEDKFVGFEKLFKALKAYSDVVKPKMSADIPFSIAHSSSNFMFSSSFAILSRKIIYEALAFLDSSSLVRDAVRR